MFLQSLKTELKTGRHKAGPYRGTDSYIARL